MKHAQLHIAHALCLLAALNLPAAVRYVDINSASPTPPYTNWSTAATTIQDAVDWSGQLAHDTVLVTNGIYQTGAAWATLGGFGSSGMSNRVAIKRPMTVRSVNGPEVTMIVGYQSPGATDGDSAVRCVFLTSGAVLAGFTLTNGTTRGLASVDEGAGGGVLCVSATAVVSNCVLVGNSAAYRGGGSFRGTLKKCTLKDNSVWDVGGGVYSGTLNNCVLMGNRAGYDGGGAAGGFNDVCVINDCILIGNRAAYGGGAASTGSGRSDNVRLNRCLVISNSASTTGGGVYLGTLTNCVLLGNSAGRGGGAAGEWFEPFRLSSLNNCTLMGNSGSSCGGVYRGTLKNCIAYYNTAFTSGENYDATSTLSYSCAIPLPLSGAANITNAPLFVDEAGGDLRLQSNSPCINAGLTVGGLGTIDLDGNPRVAGLKVDIGAYEFQGAGLSDFTDWLWQHGLRTDGSSDYSDSDSDLLNNWQEWIAGTVPTDASSVLRLFSPSNGESSVTVSWQSVSNRTYFLERATNFGATSSFSLLTSNIVGHAGATSFTDTNASGPGPFFYRVGVQ